MLPWTLTELTRILFLLRLLLLGLLSRGKIANVECNKLLASNVFMWLTWLVQAIPLLIFTTPAIAKATEGEEGTVLRSALGTRT